MSNNQPWNPEPKEPARPPAILPAQKAPGSQRIPIHSLWPTCTGRYGTRGPAFQSATKRGRIRRHRKYLHRLNQQEATRERQGTRRFLVPMATIALLLWLVLSTLFVGAMGLTGAIQQRFGAKVVTLQDILPGDNLKMYDRHGTLVYQMTRDGLQTSVPFSQISRKLINAEVAIEDHSFWKNAGFDLTGIVRAAIADLTHGHVVAGGSTITQQLIKNTLVGNRDSILRKLQEVILAPRLRAAIPSSRSSRCISIRFITESKPMERMPQPFGILI